MTDTSAIRHVQSQSSNTATPPVAIFTAVPVLLLVSSCRTRQR
jgi:hypothetical protein